MPAERRRVAALGLAALLGLAACVPPTQTPTPVAPTSTTVAPAKPTAAPAASAAVSPVAASPVASPAAAPAASPAASPAAKPAASPAASPAVAVAASPSPVVRPTPRPAPQPPVAGAFGFGRAATPDEIKKIDIDVRPDGVGLPAGSGTAAQGRPIFAQKCAGCHGANGEGTPAGPKLVDPTPFKTGTTTATVGNYWPYATTVWDYINRAMPFDKPGSLQADEVYALTAFLLAENKVIGEGEVMDARSLPQVKMPNVGNFTSPDPRPDVP
jgi:cytochrome c